MADVLVMLLTWNKASAPNTQASIFASFVEEPSSRYLSNALRSTGITYFSALTVMNVAQIVVESTSLQSFSPTALFIFSLTPILISRFLLDLRQVGQRDNSMETLALTRMSLGCQASLSMVTDSSGRNVPGQPEEEEDYEDVIDISNVALEKLYGRSSK
ncbi:hypothetical protein EW026_g5376 [Hermanssonia centrifuga]|uniref:Uncharacterized protein n=1 Tax=Hermanssonia centrifuga TaxID=98765 RepID=A0A4S4KG11_9APHY|nr:hypothetical protein EW026_g5376 [Hermanssonia centrifuga]